jgi:hypothetical protein
MQAKSSRDPARCPGTRCLISSNAHNVSESKPPANCKTTNDQILAFSLSLSTQNAVYLVLHPYKILIFLFCLIYNSDPSSFRIHDFSPSIFKISDIFTTYAFVLLMAIAH